MEDALKATVKSLCPICLDSTMDTDIIVKDEKEQAEMNDQIYGYMKSPCTECSVQLAQNRILLVEILADELEEGTTMVNDMTSKRTGKLLWIGRDDLLRICDEVQAQYVTGGVEYVCVEEGAIDEFLKLKGMQDDNTEQG